MGGGCFFSISSVLLLLVLLVAVSVPTYAAIERSFSWWRKGMLRLGSLGERSKTSVTFKY